MRGTSMPDDVRARLLAEYPHESNAALSVRYGLNERQLVYIAYRAGIKKTPAVLAAMHRAAHPEMVARREQLRQALLQSGAAGVSYTGAHVVCGEALSNRQLSVLLRQLVDDGHAHRAGPHLYTRWFASAEHAAAYALQPAPQRTTRRKLTEAERAERRQQRAELRAQKRQQQATPGRKPRAQALLAKGPVCNTVQVRLPRPPALVAGEPVITERTRFTTCPPVPGPEARWHTDAKPLFSALPIGQLPDEPSPWAAAVTGTHPQASPRKL